MQSIITGVFSLQSLYLVNPPLHQALAEGLHDQQLNAVHGKRGLLGYLGEGDLSGGGFSPEGHLHQTEEADLLEQLVLVCLEVGLGLPLGLHGLELAHVSAVEDKQEVDEPGVLCPSEGLQDLVGQQLSEVVDLVPQQGGQGEEEGVLGLLLLAEVLELGAAEVLEAGGVELPVVALDPVEVAAEQVELRVDGADTVNLV